MDIRIVASYPATDGRTPETIEVEVSNIDSSIGAMEPLALKAIPDIIRRLAEVPGIGARTYEVRL